MLVSQCSHQDREPFGRVCEHLLGSHDAEHIKRFNGVAQSYDLVCGPCSREPDKIDAALLNVCIECFRAIEGNRWQEEGIIGKPQVLLRSSTLRFEHSDIRLPELAGVQVLEVQPIETSQGAWLVCTSTGALLEVVPAQQSVRLVAQVPHDALDFDGTHIRGLTESWLKEPASVLRISRKGELAVVANRYGRKAVVIDLASGKIVRHLLRDDYHEDVSSFPLAFLELDNRVLLVHGTDWNRLDVSDARTGTLLTEREPTSYKSGEPRPEHYLDYFHCSLSISPGQQYIADNGWVWHPVGMVTSWHIDRWVKENVWESEDGQSKRELCWRSYYWDGPLCWISDHELAVWGYGRDDQWLIPAVCIFDVRTGAGLRWFAGPNCKIGSLTFDGHLFSYDKQNGMSVWDIATGEMLLSEPGFCPSGYHPGTRQFFTPMKDGTIRLSWLEDA